MSRIKVDKEIQRLRIKEYKRLYFQKNKEKIYLRRNQKPIEKQQRDGYYIKSRYGISIGDYNKMLIDRNFCCDICGYRQPQNATKQERLYIDHCHIKNKVRGLLCFYCNTAIGYFKDNVEVINKSIKYLEKWKDI
jgi:phage gp36-like protein